MHNSYYYDIVYKRIVYRYYVYVLTPHYYTVYVFAASSAFILVDKLRLYLLED